MKSISKFSWGLEAYIKKCLWVLLTHIYWFRATGGYICGCGRPSNLVLFRFFLEILNSAPSLLAKWEVVSLSSRYFFDGRNVLKRTKISTSEKPHILHVVVGPIRLKPVWKFDVWIATATFPYILENVPIYNHNEANFLYVLIGKHSDIRSGFDGTNWCTVESQCGLKRFCVLFTMVSICVKLGPAVKKINN